MLEMVHGNMNSFDPPSFHPHRFFRGGHLQTLAAIRSPTMPTLPTRPHVVDLGDGDSLVLHDDCPLDWAVGNPSIVLIHGLAGCHTSPYMLRLAQRFFVDGTRVFRMDLRGCGAGVALASHLTHAGRSDDVLTALGKVASLTAGSGTVPTTPASTTAGAIGAVAISLSANQLLRALGRVGGGHQPRPDWLARLTRIAAISPPLDLRRCSLNMNRWSRRPYNRYFIRGLLARVPPRVRQRAEFQRAIAGPLPQTLWQLDDRFTAPLSGFCGAEEYYADSSAIHVTQANEIPSLVVAARDDPMVPVGCFEEDPQIWPAATELLISDTGGHVGFVDRHGKSWMDEVVVAWFRAGGFGR